jgi:4-diphosphocytidyl-2C-methyl-D-erythritol kinase
MDRADMCAEVLRRMGLKVGEDDPAFLLVELNRLALEEAVSIVVERLTPLPGSIEQAGVALAKGVASATQRVVDEEFAEARKKIAREADAARAAAARAISELTREQRQAHTDKWIALGYLFGCLSVVGGFSAGFLIALVFNTSVLERW